MMRLGLLVVGCALLCGAASRSMAQDRAAARGAGPVVAPSASPEAAGAEGAAIRAVLERQATDWNRGDLDAFASGYKNAPDILFIGAKIAHGYAGMLAGYKAHYPTREAMGTLRFTGLEVQPLAERFATATGKFALERTAAGGGPAGGYFLLVLEKTAAGWKIVRDDTTVPCLKGK